MQVAITATGVGRCGSVALTVAPSSGGPVHFRQHHTDPSQPTYGAERSNSRSRDVFVLRSPAEHPPDAVDMIVDTLPAPTRLDHRLADLFQRHRAERSGTRLTADLDNVPERRLDAGHFGRFSAALAVARPGVFEYSRARSSQVSVTRPTSCLAIHSAMSSSYCWRLSGEPYGPK